MAHFYGTLSGNRGDASRLGTADSGLRVTACSWEGAVHVRLYMQDGKDYAHVKLAQHHGHGTNQTLYDGPVAGMPVKAT